jgi:hypothetical protein
MVLRAPVNAREALLEKNKISLFFKEKSFQWCEIFTSYPLALSRFKILESFLCSFPNDNALNASHGRPFPAPRNEAINGCGLSLRFDVHRAIRVVLGKSCDIHFLCGRACEVPESNALHVSKNCDVYVPHRCKNC